MKSEMDEWWPDTTPHVGAAQASTEDEAGPEQFAGSLIVPDIEARRGWRQYYVRKERKVDTRSIGFRR